MPEMHREEFRALARKGEVVLNEAGRKLVDLLGERIPVEHDRVLRIVDDAFDAMEIMVRNQRSFAHQLVDSLTGQAVKAASPKPAAKKAPATRKAAKKPAARKPAARKPAKKVAARRPAA